MIERAATVVLTFIALLAGHVAIASTLLGSGYGTPRFVANVPVIQTKPAAACKTAT